MSELRKLLDELDADNNNNNTTGVNNQVINHSNEKSELRNLLNELDAETKPNDVGGFVASAKQSLGATIKGAGQVASDLGIADKDNSLTRYGKEVISANPTVVKGFSDILDNPGKTVTESVGNAAGSMGAMLGVRALGQGITAASPLAGPAAPLVAGLGQVVSWGGPAAIAALPSFGGIREVQESKNPNSDFKDKAIAALGAATVGIIESKFGPQDWALKLTTEAGRKQLAGFMADKTIMQAIGKGAVTGAAIEGAEELVQNPVEQLTGYDNPLTKEKLTETAFGGVMGAVGGGVLGGAMGPMMNRSTNQEIKTDQKTTEQTTQPETETTQPEVSNTEVIVNGKRDFEAEKQLAKQSADRLATIDEEFKQKFRDVEADKAKLDSGEMSTDEFIKKYELEEIVSVLKPEQTEQTVQSEQTAQSNQQTVKNDGGISVAAEADAQYKSAQNVYDDALESVNGDKLKVPSNIVTTLQIAKANAKTAHHNLSFVDNSKNNQQSVSTEVLLNPAKVAKAVGADQVITDMNKVGIPIVPEAPTNIYDIQNQEREKRKLISENLAELDSRRRSTPEETIATFEKAPINQPELSTVDREKVIQTTIAQIRQEPDKATREKMYADLWLQHGIRSAQQSAEVFEKISPFINEQQSSEPRQANNIQVASLPELESKLGINKQQLSVLNEQINNTTDSDERIALQQEASALYAENDSLETQWNKQYQVENQATLPDASAEAAFQSGDAQFQVSENKASSFTNERQGEQPPQFKPVDHTSPNFKNWFAGSQVKDENNNPLHVYHGSTTFGINKDDKWVFNSAKLGKNVHSPLTGLGHFFATDMNDSLGYTDGAKGALHTVYLNIKNPLEMNSWEFPAFNSSAEARAFAKRKELQGYDGFFIKDEGHYIAFNPEQIKSGEINTGKFDSNNPDIRYQTTEQADLSKINLEDIKKAFPNQEVIQSTDGTISVRFKNGKGLTIKSIQGAGQGFVKLAIETGQMSKTGKILGITIGSDILLDEIFADNKTLWHENKHVLDNLGMITAADDSALNAEFNKLRKAGKLEFALSTHEGAKQRMVENRANMFAQIMINREAYRNTTFGKTIQRIMDFFQQMLNFGKQTVSGLAREVESGKIYERLANNQTLEGKELMQVAQAFYSRLQSAVFNDFPAELKAQKVIPYLKSKLKNTNEQRPYQEIQAIGLQEWLNAKKPTDIVTKEELSNFVKANMVELDDVVLGTPGYERWPVYDNHGQFFQYTKNENDAKEMASKIGGNIAAPNTRSEDIPTHFSQYTEPGAVEGSYREMFVTTVNALKTTNEIGDVRGMIAGTGKTLEQGIQAARATSWEDGHQQYSDIENPIVRIRFNEVTADGKRILRIEEMQGPSTENQSKMPKHLKENIYQLGIKRILAYAKENGFDGVALVTKPGRTAGETQADRYSLEKQLDYIAYKKTSEGKYSITPIKDKANVLEKESENPLTKSELVSLVGKGIAEKIINDEGIAGKTPYQRGNDLRILEGEDLKIGGEGLKKLYDQQLPAILEAYGKGKLESAESNINEDVKISKEEALNTFNDNRMIFIGNKIAEKISDIMRYQGTDITTAMPMKIKYLPITAKSSDSFSMFQVSEQKIPQADYDALKAEKNNLLQSYAQQARIKFHEIKLLADKALGSISTRLKNVDPELSEHLRWLDFKTSQKIIDILKVAKPILDITNGAKNVLGVRQGGMTADDRIEWNWARLNSDKGKIELLAQRYNLTENLITLREKLNQLREEAIKVGYDVGFIDEYWPRVIKDQEGFLQATQKISQRPAFTEAIRAQAKKLGITQEVFERDFPEVKADIISNLILGTHRGIGGPGNVQSRVFETIDKKYASFYMDADAALMQYVYSMTKKIEARKFFGKVPQRISDLKTSKKRKQAELIKLNMLADIARAENPEKLVELDARITQLNEDIIRIDEPLNEYKLQNDYTENIGSYIDQMRIEERIQKKDEKTVRDILDARFHEHGTHGIVNAYKNFSYIDTMGSPMSAITQIGDLAWAMYVGKIWTPNGLLSTGKNLIKAISGKSDITKEDLGIERIAQEFADGTTLSKGVSWVFKRVGLEKMDSIGKEVLINNALDQFKVQAKANPKALARLIRPTFKDKSTEVVQDILAGNPSDNVKMLLYSRLLDFQPVALSEMPELYLNGGNGRVFYMLKTYTLKQFDVFRKEVIHNLKSDNPQQKLQGLTNMVQLMALLTLANAGADELKDFLLGKETKFSDHVIENFLTMGGASRYTRMQVTKDGIGSALAQQILPPMKFINAASKDANEGYNNYVSGDVSKFDHARIIDSIPGIGKLYYWHYGRGAENKQSIAEKEFKEASKDARLFKKQLENSQDKRLFIESNLDRFKQAKLQENFQSSLSRNEAVINKLKKIPSTENVQTRLGQLKSQREQILKRYQEVAGTMQ